MKASDQLFLLIKSMNKSEKGYFKKFSSKHIIGGQNNYIRLFDAIDSQKEYDEAAIKKKFEGKTFIKYLPSEKNYLYNLILDMLHVYDVNNNPESILSKQLHQA